MPIFDISIKLDHKTIAWPGSEGLMIDQYMTIPAETANVSRFKMDCHLGTHFDAQSHFIVNGYKCSDYRVERFIGECYLVNLVGTKVITRSLLESKQIPAGVTKLLLRANDLFARSAVFEPDFCALDQSGAEWIVEKGIDLVGIDYLSIESFNTTDYMVHKTLLKANVIVLESLNLQNIGGGRYNLIALPLHLQNTEAAPVRAILQTIEVYDDKKI